MKRYLLIIFALAQICLSWNLCGQAKSSWYNDYPKVNVTQDAIVLDTLKAKAVCFKHNGQYYVYLDSILVIGETSFRFSIYMDNGGGVFYEMNSGKKANSPNLVSDRSKPRIVGPVSDNTDSVRFRIHKGDEDEYVNLRFRNRIPEPETELLDTVNLYLEAGREICDTIRTLDVIEPKYSVYHSLALNGNLIHQSDSIADYNDPETEDRIKVDLASHWGELKPGSNTLTVTVMVLDENCKFDKKLTRDYILLIKSSAPPASSLGRILKYGIYILAALIILLIVAGTVVFLQGRKKKNILLADLLQSKIEILNPLEDSSLSNESKEKLEIYQKKVEKKIKFIQNERILKRSYQCKARELLDEVNGILSLIREESMRPVAMPDSGHDQKDDLAKMAEVFQVKLEELQIRLAQAQNEKEEALTQQRNQLDSQHDENVMTLRIGYEQQLTSLNAEKEELAAKLVEQMNQLMTLRIGYEQQLTSLNAEKEEQAANLVEQKKSFEEQKRYYEKLISEMDEALGKKYETLSNELKVTTDKWLEDKKFISDMYGSHLDRLNDLIENVKSKADMASVSYVEIMQMHSESVHSFHSFVEQFRAIMSEELTVAQRHSSLGKIFLTQIDYERSWINALGRLYAYAQVEGLASMFGYYDDYKTDISTLFNELVFFTGLIGFKHLTIPVLFVDKYDAKTAEAKNTNLVLPGLYPAYVELLQSSVIYDIHTLGYTYEGLSKKPKVAYYFA